MMKACPIWGLKAGDYAGSVIFAETRGGKKSQEEGLTGKRYFARKGKA
jgi:hypothetical protein